MVLPYRVGGNAARDYGDAPGVQHPGRKPFSAEEVARNPIRAELR